MQCPYCHNEISDGLTVCPFCNRDINENAIAAVNMMGFLKMFG